MSCKDCLFNLKCDTVGKICEHFIGVDGLYLLILQYCMYFGVPYNDEAKKETVSKLKEYFDYMWFQKERGYSIYNIVDWNMNGGI